jgi:hypothetical protein
VLPSPGFPPGAFSLAERSSGWICRWCRLGAYFVGRYGLCVAVNDFLKRFGRVRCYLIEPIEQSITARFLEV